MKCLSKEQYMCKLIFKLGPQPMPCNNRPHRCPAILCTPTKRKAIVFYHDHLNKSFCWIAKEAPEFANTKTTHVTISQNYNVAKEKGCYHYVKHTGHPPHFSSEEMTAAVDAIDTGHAVDGADLGHRLFPHAPACTI